MIRQRVDIIEATSNKFELRQMLTVPDDRQGNWLSEVANKTICAVAAIISRFDVGDWPLDLREGALPYNTKNHYGAGNNPYHDILGIPRATLLESSTQDVDTRKSAPLENAGAVFDEQLPDGAFSPVGARGGGGSMARFTMLGRGSGRTEISAANRKSYDKRRNVRAGALRVSCSVAIASNQRLRMTFGLAQPEYGGSLNVPKVMQTTA